MEEQEVELSFEDLTFGGDKEDELESSAKERENNVIFVTTSYGGKLNVPIILKLVEQYGTILLNNFREKQSFGFIQLDSVEAVEKSIINLNNIEIDGFKINFERINKITPGRDPRTHESTSEFKNTTLVLKNLPFQLKQEKLEEILNVLEYKPISVSYLSDGTGLFRGMAFVKYKEIEESTKVFDCINNMDINGRKLRVEYKRKVAEAEAEDNAQKLLDQLSNFKNNYSIGELAFPCGSSFQRKQIHQLAEKLGLSHFSTGEGETRYVLLKKKDSEVGMISPSSSPVGTPSGKGQPIKSFGGNRKTEYKQKNSFDGRSMSPDEKFQFGSPETKSSRSFGANSFGSIKSPPQHLSATSGSLTTASPKYGNSALVFNRILQEGPAISPQRQPKGPDGTTGFSESYRKARKKE